MARWTLDDVAVPAEHVVSRAFDDAVMVMDLETGRYVELNATGVTVWDAVVGARALRTAAGALAEAYGVDPDLAGRDVLALVEDLAGRGLVRRDAP